ncbi:MAG: DNA processing protein DprA [Candidatus Erwinia impunctatus]|nr:DNA processing protein DprA [Culicoides impunctatus]
MTLVEIWLRLSAINGLKASQRVKLATYLRSHSGPDDEILHRAGLSPLAIDQFQGVNQQEIDEALCWLENPQHHFITATGCEYPWLLKQTANHPPFLFVAGDPALLSSPQLAIVGSRDNSLYGQQWGDYFAQILAEQGLTITSGLARGIDGIAHRGALSVHGKTIAVLGNGLLTCYPRQHDSLAREIIATGGALVSEFPLKAPPRAHHFSRRNRIVSGLSLGVLIVEATLRSGSLVTARYALEQNRDVYALPGPLGKTNSEGAHWLTTTGALLVSHPETILEQLQSDLHWLPSSSQTAQYSTELENTPLPFPEVLDNVGDEVTPVDVVAERAGQSVPSVVAKLLELELAGWIAAVPGGYVRLRRASHVRRTHVLI